MTVRSLTYIHDVLERAIHEVPSVEVRGRVIEVTGTIIKAVVPGAKVGGLCLLRDTKEGWQLQAEVVGFAKDAALLTPLGSLHGISGATEVLPSNRGHVVPVGPKLLGRVLNGLGEPMDAKELGRLEVEKHYPVYASPPNPLTRRMITRPISLGLRVIDGLLTCGEGQRIGIFAAAGVGKSSLLAQIMRNTEAEVVVLALIGERGREVREFIERDLGAEGLQRSVLVISTSDRPAMERLKAAYVATAIAEYFRDNGVRVLLLMDSVTRFARAQREIGLAAGEPPTRRGFPPSVFATMPQLMERAGWSETGSITALYTVLVEGDDMTEPVADETRAILDGHFVLSRKLAASNHYPAVDVGASISRVMDHVIATPHKQAAAKLRSLLAKYQEVELLVQLGEYKAGTDAIADEAIRKMSAIRKFLCQRTDEHVRFQDTVNALIKLVQ